MKNNYKDNVISDFEQKRQRAFIDRDRRVKNIYESFPEIKKIDEMVSKLATALSMKALENKNAYEEEKSQVLLELEQLKADKRKILINEGLPEDFMSIRYECEKCSDKGYLDSGTKCDCFRKALVDAAYEASSLRGLLREENFDSFNLNLYSDSPYNNEKKSPRENMAEILAISLKFVENFDNARNLFFYGGTGLGKTFTSSAIVKAVLDKEKTVVYESIFSVMDICQNYRFKNYIKDSEMEYRMFFDSDLLVIDDLGSETVNSFTNAELFNIINHRIMNGKRMVISSNLSPKKISDIYSERIFSRIMSDFIPLRFYGDDLRAKNI